MNQVTRKPIHRWYQFSIRTAFLVMTITAVFLSRVTFLQQKAAFHEREAEKWKVRFAHDHHGSVQQVNEIAKMFRGPLVIGISSTGHKSEAQIPPEIKTIQHHEDMAITYRRAVWQPWKHVQASLPPSHSDD